MPNEIIYIDAVDKYNKMYGIETLHPLVSIVHHEKFPKGKNILNLHYEVYAIFLKHGEGCSIRYGREKYDYKDGTIVCFKPGQTITVKWDDSLPMPPSIGLLFHPDIIHGTPLGRHIYDYTFFNYDQHEALHLSEREQKIIADTMESIQEELAQPIDKHSQGIISDRIKLVLDYCLRFYDRQFITRHHVNNDIISKFERLLSEYFTGDQTKENGLPTVAYFADKVCLSTGYFGDLIKKETGQTAQNYIQNYVINYAKHLIKDSSLSISQISDNLGFQYPQHFTRMFKNKIGMTPNEYRHG